MESKQLIITGAPATGKSRLLREIQQKHPEYDQHFHFVEDGGRWWLEKYAQEIGRLVSVDQLDKPTRRTMQLDIMDYYIAHIHEAKDAGKHMLSDVGLGEAYLYGMGCVDPHYLSLMRGAFQGCRARITALLLPTDHLPHEVDGVRHADPLFREYMEEQIVKLYHRHNVPLIQATSAFMEDRILQLTNLMDQTVRGVSLEQLFSDNQTA